MSTSVSVSDVIVSLVVLPPDVIASPIVLSDVTVSPMVLSDDVIMCIPQVL